MLKIEIEKNKQNKKVSEINVKDFANQLYRDVNGKNAHHIVIKEMDIQGVHKSERRHKIWNT